jgi:tripartite-type tricarboxylate transporter receptor subunit TctC
MPPTTMITKRLLLQALAAGPIALHLPGVHAQADKAANWPSRPLRIIVGFPPGSTPDLCARAISDGLAKALGQPIVVDNKPGASGNIAADLVAKATDGHTVGLVINGNLTVAKLLNPATPFDPAKDFAPVSLLTTAPLVLVAAGSAPGHTAAELLQWARGLGDKGNYGTPGPGTVGHLGMELLKSKTGIAALHVPFNGNPAVVNALIAGQIQLALLPPGLAIAQVKAGRLKAIAATSPVRSGLAPEVPALREIGVAGADLEVWNALVGPASMPPAVVAELSAAVVEVIRQPETRSRLLSVGWQTAGTAPEALANRMRADTAQMARIIETQGIRVGS